MISTNPTDNNTSKIYVKRSVLVINKLKNVTNYNKLHNTTHSTDSKKPSEGTDQLLN